MSTDDRDPAPPAAASPRAGVDPDARLAYVSAWMLGLSGLSAGQIVVRLLVGALPAHLHLRDPPFFAVALHAVAAVAWLLASRGLRRGAPAARLAVVVASIGMVMGTWAAFNTAIARPAPDTVALLEAMAESWRGVGWPGMLAHVDEFQLVPTAAWRPVHVALGLFVACVAGIALRFSLTGRTFARTARRTTTPPGGRAGGYVLAIHVALYAFLTIADIVALGARVISRLGSH